jgi:hypothetical protein
MSGGKSNSVSNVKKINHDTVDGQIKLGHLKFNLCKSTIELSINLSMSI